MKMGFDIRVASWATIRESKLTIDGYSADLSLQAHRARAASGEGLSVKKI